MRQLFLECADVVVIALSDERVEAAWDDESVLADQSVASLAGHLARGGVRAVGGYVDADAPDGPVTFDGAASYFATLMDQVGEEDHRAIRARSAEVASVGYRALIDRLSTELEGLRLRLEVEPGDRIVSVYQGTSIRLDDYLQTRIVEQVVHLDDLAQSIGVDPWPMPSGAEALTVGVGAEVGRLRFGAPAMIRALFRQDASALPVL